MNLQDHGDKKKNFKNTNYPWESVRTQNFPKN